MASPSTRMYALLSAVCAKVQLCVSARACVANACPPFMDAVPPFIDVVPPFMDSRKHLSQVCARVHTRARCTPQLPHTHTHTHTHVHPPTHTHTHARTRTRTHTRTQTPLKCARSPLNCADLNAHSGHLNVAAATAASSCCRCGWVGGGSIHKWRHCIHKWRHCIHKWRTWVRRRDAICSGRPIQNIVRVQFKRTPCVWVCKFNSLSGHLNSWNDHLKALDGHLNRWPVK